MIGSQVQEQRKFPEYMLIAHLSRLEETLFLTVPQDEASSEAPSPKAIFLLLFSVCKVGTSDQLVHLVDVGEFSETAHLLRQHVYFPNLTLVVFSNAVDISVVVEHKCVVFPSSDFLHIFSVDFSPLHGKSFDEVLLILALESQLLEVVQPEAVNSLFVLKGFFGWLCNDEGTEVGCVDSLDLLPAQTSQCGPIHSTHLVVFFELVAESSLGVISETIHSSPTQNQDVVHPRLDVLDTLFVEHVVVYVFGGVLLYQHLLGALYFPPEENFCSFGIGANRVAFPCTYEVDLLGERDFRWVLWISLSAQLVRVVVSPGIKMSILVQNN